MGWDGKDCWAGLIKMRSWLGTQFMAFFWLIARILTFRDKKYRMLTFRQKVPYFNVSRQNRVVFNCFATKQCWGMLKMWGQSLFCNQPSKCTTYLLLCISFMNNSQTKSSGYNKMQRRLIVSMSLSGSLWLPLAHSGSLWLAVRLSLALSGPLWLSLARSPALSGSLWLSLALSGSLWLPLAHSGSLWLAVRLVTKVMSSSGRSLFHWLNAMAQGYVLSCQGNFLSPTVCLLSQQQSGVPPQPCIVSLTFTPSSKRLLLLALLWLLLVLLLLLPLSHRQAMCNRTNLGQ